MCAKTLGLYTDFNDGVLPVSISSVSVICVCIHLVVVEIVGVDMLNLDLPVQTLFFLNSVLLAIELVFVVEVYYTFAVIVRVHAKLDTNDWPSVVLHRM